MGSNVAFVDRVTSIRDVRIQNSDSPISVEDRHPLISWKMVSPRRGQRTAPIGFRSSATTEANSGTPVKSKATDRWASRTRGGLQPEKSYTVNVSVWDKDGDRYDETTRFETGIMNPRISAQNGRTGSVRGS